LNINRGGWKKAVFLGCTHGNYINWEVANKALAFVDEYKPQLRVHLGDAFDTAAFRAGAKGSNDESASVGDDFAAGQEFLNQYRPHLLFMGNHEDRLFTLMHHHNAITAHLAKHLVDDIRRMAAKWKAQIVEYRSIASPESCGDAGPQGDPRPRP